jgi:hypothetical protein
MTRVATILAMVIVLSGGLGCAHSGDAMGGEQEFEEFEEQGGADEAERDHSGGDPRFYRDSD